MNGGADVPTGTRLDPATVRARARELQLAVPASAANLGPGFDTLALALQLYLRVRVCEVSDNAVNGLDFDLCGGRLSGDNYIERSFRALAARDGIDVPSLAIEVRSEIPMRGGLGSSAAATVAGLLLYHHLVAPQSPEDLLAWATRLDRHADNVSAALLGGLTISCVQDDGRVIAQALPWPTDVQLVVAMPAVEVATPDARKVLPDQYARRDAVFNLQRALLLVQAVQRRDYGCLREALRDRWHQPYRAAIVPGLSEVLALDHPALIGACLSGSGPAVLAFATGAVPDIERLLVAVYERLGVPCTVRALSAHQPGASA